MIAYKIRIDDIGRIQIPKDLRLYLDIHEGDTLDVFANLDGEIVIRKPEIEGLKLNVAMEDEEY